MGRGEGTDGEPLSSEELLRRAREGTGGEAVEARSADEVDEQPGESLDTGAEPPSPPAVDRAPPGFVDCPSCGKPVRGILTSCVYCGTDLTAQPSRTGPLPPPPPQPMTPIRTVATTGYRSAVGLARLTQVLFGLWAVFAAVAAAASLAERRLASRLIDDPLSVSIAQIEASDDRQTALAVIWIAALVLTAIGFVAWTWRVYGNVRTLGASPSQHARGWIIGGWLVPILNLWRPKQIIDDLWRSNDPDLLAGSGGGPRGERAPPMLHLWWGLWIVGGLVSQFLYRTRDIEDFEDLRTMAGIDALVDVILAAAAVAAFWVVAALTRRQETGAGLVLANYQPKAAMAGSRPFGGAALLGGAALASVLVAFLLFDPAPIEPFSPDAGSPQEGTTGEGVLLVDVRVGDCANIPADVETILALPRMPCDSPHDVEAFSRVQHPAGADAPYPSSAALDNEAFSQCFARVESYVGAPALAAGLSVFTVVPTEESWRAGDRDILCMLQDPRLAKLTDAVRGSGGIVPDGSKAMFTLEVGDCYDDPETGVFWVPIFGCDEPHDNEVYAVVEHRAGAAEPYPGDGALTSYAATECEEAFAGSVAAADATRLDRGWITRPIGVTWDLGDRTVRCGFWDRSLAKLTESLLGG